LLPSATAVAASQPVGHLDAARQARSGAMSVSGWAYDPAHSSSSVRVEVFVDGHRARTLVANRSRADVARAHRIHGRHGFKVALHSTHRVHIVTLVARSATAGGPHHTVGVAYLNGYHPPKPKPKPSTAGNRIIAEAKKFVGRTPYVDGGTSPRTGFDCSGYVQYVYRVTKVKNLPRTAEQQRRAVRLIPRSAARAGDLVFYLSGGSAYHIAIYAGNGKQYAAATPQDGIRYQGVWSAAVQYGTTWH
jgi:cell wall-associated NlpC family hydrolase